MDINEIIMLSVGLLGLFIALITWITGKNNTKKVKLTAESDSIKILNFEIDVFVIFYVFIFFMMLLIGIISNFIIPTIITGIFASIPLILYLYALKIKNKNEVKR